MLEQNKEIAKRWMDEVNKHSLDAVPDFYTSDYVLHDATGGDIKGLDETTQFLKTFYDAFPDIQADIEDLVAEGDKVTMRFRIRGTHQGDLMGIAPTGKKIDVKALSILRVANGKFAEEWEIYDALGMLQQLGVGPEM